MVYCESVNLIGSFTVFYLLIDNSYEKPIKIILFVSHLSAIALSVSNLWIDDLNTKNIFSWALLYILCNETIVNLD